MTAYATNRFRHDLVTRDLTGITAKVYLVSAAPANAGVFADYNVVNDFVSGELSGTGYVRKTLASLAGVEDDTNDLGAWTAAALSAYTALNAGTLQGACIMRFVTNDTDSDLYLYLGTSALVTNGGDVTVAWDATHNAGTLAEIT